MTNPSPSIHSGAPAAHGITRPFLLLLLVLLSAAAPPSATAQMSNASSSSGPNVSNSNSGNSIMVILIIVLILAFLAMGFLSVYIRVWAESENSRRAAAAASAAAARRRFMRGLDLEVIQSFPIFLYSDVKDLKIGKGGELECAVCISSITEFQNDDTLRLLPKCDHVFHPECIDAWLASHSTCPLCRANVTESTQTTDTGGAQNPNQSPSQDHDQDQDESRETHIPIDVEEGGNSEVQVSEMPKRKLPRSHTTGHSLSQPGESLERYTLSLPVELMREMMSRSLKPEMLRAQQAVHSSCAQQPISPGSGRTKMIGAAHFVQNTSFKVSVKNELRSISLEALNLG